MLRFLQERVIERIGDAVKFLLIFEWCVTHRDLQPWSQTRLSGDLFYRVGEMVISIPPLRERDQMFYC